MHYGVPINFEGQISGIGTDYGSDSRVVRQSERPGGTPHFPPVSNGLDYLVSVVECLEADAPSPRDLKYVVLHLAAGAEVLLKARLQMEHWTLVFSHPGRAVRDEVENGTLTSCTPKEARERLENIVGIPVAKPDAEALDKLAKMRNALQHYGLVGQAANAQAIEMLTAKVLGFLMPFLDNHVLGRLTEDEQDEVEHELVRIRSGLRDIQAYAVERLRALGPQLGPLRSRTLECPQCSQWAYVPSPTPVPDTRRPDRVYYVTTCYFCEIQHVDSETAAFQYLVNHTVYEYRNAVGETVYPSRPFVCPRCATSSLAPRARLATDPDTEVDFCFCRAAPVSAPS
ncbi:hypothetical protein [Streptomyces maremycinicus]|uniref:hypothetical protein n=1 Tax=Streptomyces maremycinicus TaxID=1679753 RepID=UPI0007877C72|nr:hypothetical protein [Streptomyces sp. NBRC 110468]